tara:strand:+ start:1556 stop:1819 length:264 start_codon:yes stop_codon:yes gene_type:complete
MQNFTEDNFIAELNKKINANFEQVEDKIYLHVEEDLEISVDFNDYPPKMTFTNVQSCDTELLHISKRVKSFRYASQETNKSYLRESY